MGIPTKKSHFSIFRAFFEINLIQFLVLTVMYYRIFFYGFELKKNFSATTREGKNRKTFLKKNIHFFTKKYFHENHFFEFFLADGCAEIFF